MRVLLGREGLCAGKQGLAHQGQGCAEWSTLQAGAAEVLGAGYLWKVLSQGWSSESKSSQASMKRNTVGRMCPRCEGKRKTFGWGITEEISLP